MYSLVVRPLQDLQLYITYVFIIAKTFHFAIAWKSENAFHAIAYGKRMILHVNVFRVVVNVR
jgi:hypothetical protein